MKAVLLIFIVYLFTLNISAKIINKVAIIGAGPGGLSLYTSLKKLSSGILIDMIFHIILHLILLKFQQKLNILLFSKLKKMLNKVRICYYNINVYVPNKGFFKCNVLFPKLPWAEEFSSQAELSF